MASRGSRRNSRHNPIIPVESHSPDLSETSTPEPVASMPEYDAAWRGLYVGELTVWGLQSWLPFLPDDVDSAAADGTSLTFSEWLIDRHGLVGAVIWPILTSVLSLAGILLFLLIGAAVVWEVVQPYR